MQAMLVVRPKYFPASSGARERLSEGAYANAPLPDNSVEGMPQNDGLLAIRARRDDVDGYTRELLQPREIVLRVLRQRTVALDADGGFTPARHLLVNRLHVGERVREHGRLLHDLAIATLFRMTVAHADLQRV